VHWVSPLPPAETDIAHYTARILPELAESVDLTLWTDEEDWDPALEAHCPVRHFEPDRLLPRDLVAAGQKGAAGGEVIFLNIGNYWLYHSGILALSRRLPAVVVLHDIAIQDLFCEAIRYQRTDRAGYLAGMARWYGAEGESLARRMLELEVTPAEVTPKAPGFELTLERAISALTHTRMAFDSVVSRDLLPVHLLDLPFAPAAEPPSPERDRDGPLRLVQFGYIGPNRRLEPVLEVLAGLADTVDFRFDIMGKIWDPGHIEDRIAALGLSDRVLVHGFVKEPALDYCLSKAHLVFNLRYPSVGEASGSQLRIWNAAAAAVVTDTGFYASLPEDTVFKISHAEEAQALRELILRIDADRGLGAGIGRAGWDRLQQYHTPKRYAAGIAEVARQAVADGGRSLLARRGRDLLARAPGPSGLLRDRLARQL
jgi:glycosyltransferase involved in cell wall biosynthesis